MAAPTIPGTLGGAVSAATTAAPAAPSLESLGSLGALPSPGLGLGLDSSMFSGQAAAQAQPQLMSRAPAAATAASLMTPSTTAGLGATPMSVATPVAPAAATAPVLTLEQQQQQIANMSQHSIAAAAASRQHQLQQQAVALRQVRSALFAPTPALCRVAPSLTHIPEFFLGSGPGCRCGGCSAADGSARRPGGPVGTTPQGDPGATSPPHPRPQVHRSVRIVRHCPLWNNERGADAHVCVQARKELPVRSPSTPFNSPSFERSGEPGANLTSSTAGTRTAARPGKLLRIIRTVRSQTARSVPHSASRRSRRPGRLPALQEAPTGGSIRPAPSRPGPTRGTHGLTNHTVSNCGPSLSRRLRIVCRKRSSIQRWRTSSSLQRRLRSRCTCKPPSRRTTTTSSLRRLVFQREMLRLTVLTFPLPPPDL